MEVFPLSFAALQPIRWPLNSRLLKILSLAFVCFSGDIALYAQVILSDLTELQMVAHGSDNYIVTIHSTGQPLMRIRPVKGQGNANIYPIDARRSSPYDKRLVGLYWSQFLMIGADPATGKDFLTDKVESEGQKLEAFHVIRSSGNIIEYDGTWSFRDLFTTTAHHWIWVDGNDHYHRVRVSMDVLKPINDVKAIWTELFNSPDAFATVTVKTRDDGVRTANITGSTNEHYLGEFELGPDDWLAFSDPQKGQGGSVARVFLSSHSDIRASNEVTPIWANFDRYDNIELHVHRQFPGVRMQPGTRFFMDNLLITNPTRDNTDWVEAKIRRAKACTELVGPSIDAPMVLSGAVQQ